MPLEIHPERGGDTRKPRLILPIAIWLGIILGSIVILTQLTGCAAERYLTAEQDAKMREFCATDGCEIVPSPLWQQIEIIFRRLGMPLT